MARAEAKRAEAGVLSAVVTRGLRESAFWIFGAFALILFVALASYDRADPAFSSTGQPGPVTNLIGPFGAWISDLLFVLFGAPAFLFPILLGVAGWALFQGRSGLETTDRRSLGFRGLGFLLALASSCGLATLHFSPGDYPNTAGGVLGSMLGDGLASAMSFLGATLLLLAVWLGSVSLFTGVSWLGAMDRIGHGVLDSLSWIRDRLSTARDVKAGREVRQARAEVVREEQKKVAERKPPKIEPVAPKVEKSDRVEKERQVPLFEKPGSTALPPLSLLDDAPPRQGGYSAEALEAMSRLVELKLRDFGVEAEVVEVHPGPVITRFELRPAPGVKVSQISNLAKDLARALSAISVRVVEIIPGKSTMGLEIPNEAREIVTLGEIIKSKAYDELASPLALVLGKDIGGAPVVADLTRMPHLLVGGTTGSGKSTAVNAMVLSLLYKSSAEHVRLIMIDPKMLELSVYEGIPHLLAPVVTDMKQAANALRWCVAEMERRYQLMATTGVRNLVGFNRKIQEANDAGRPIRDPIEMKRLPPGGDPRDRAAAGAAALRGGDRRRAGRHDVDRRQEGRGADHPPCPEGARLGYTPDPRHAATVGRRDHGSHQGQHPDPHRLPGVGQGRLAHHPRPERRRVAARSRRHAVPAAGYLGAGARARSFRLRPGSAQGGGFAAGHEAADVRR